MFTHISRCFTPFVAILLCLLSVNVFAMPVAEHGQLASKLMGNFPQEKAAAELIVGAARYLFWSLATISLVWTMATVLLRRADFGELFLELIRFIVFTGLFYWLLDQASGDKGFIYNIFDSFKQMGGATGDNGGLGDAANGVINIGLDVFYRVLDQAQNTEANDTLILAGMSLVILGALTLVAAQMVLVVIMAWMLAYGGIFLLGFGGARWTSLIAINYYKHALAIGIALLALLSLMRFGFNFLAGIAKPLVQVDGTAVDYVDLANMFVVALIMAVLGIKLPGLLYTLVTGSPLGLLAGTASMAGTAIITGGSGAIAAAGDAMAQRSASRHENHYETAVDAFRNVSPDLQRGDTIHQAMNMAGYGTTLHRQARSKPEASVFGGPPSANTWSGATSGRQAAQQPGKASMQAPPATSQVSKPDVAAAQDSSSGREELRDTSFAPVQKNNTEDLARTGAISGVMERAAFQQSLDAHSTARMTSQAPSSMEHMLSGGFQPTALPTPTTFTVPVGQTGQPAVVLEAPPIQRAADRGTASFTTQQQASPEIKSMPQPERATSGAASDATRAPSWGFQPAALAPATTRREGTHAPVQPLGSLEPVPPNENVGKAVARQIKPKVVARREPGVDQDTVDGRHRVGDQASAADVDDEVAAFRERRQSPREDDGGVA
jgi:type IV secretion system protein VirB6/type IV secretion system protein TrbL